jgi:excisionase family DNA binding protein
MIRLLTQQEVAAVLRVSERTVARLRADGKLPAIPGRPVKIDERDLFAYIERSKQCHAPTEGRISSPATTGITKSGGPKTDDRSAVLQAHRIMHRLRRSSPTSFS